jgi:hypothetical protein
MLLFFGACGNWSSNDDATSGEGQLNSEGQKSHYNYREVPCTLINSRPSNLHMKLLKLRYCEIFILCARDNISKVAYWLCAYLVVCNVPGQLALI